MRMHKVLSASQAATELPGNELYLKCHLFVYWKCQEHAMYHVPVIVMEMLAETCPILNHEMLMTVQVHLSGGSTGADM